MKERLSEEFIAMRAARELRPGECCNLGVGIPTLCALYVTDGVSVEAENGALGYGPLIAEESEIDPDNVDAGGSFFAVAPGLSYFDMLTSFALIRSGRLTSIIGGLQVSEKGDLANHSLGEDDKQSTIGGAMDLAYGARRVIVTMTHTAKGNRPKIVKELTLPPTGKGVVDLIVTDLAVIAVTGEGLILQEVAPGWTSEEVQALTEPKLTVSPDLKEIAL